MSHLYSGCCGINDAKGCYNRIDHTFVILVFMFFDVPWLVATNLFQVLQEARHCIKTGYGVSEPVYGNNDEDKPIA